MCPARRGRRGIDEWKISSGRILLHANRANEGNGMEWDV